MDKKTEKMAYEVSETLLIVGGANWGLHAFADFNLVEYLAELANVPVIQEIVYGAVAASAVFLAWYKWMK